MGQPSLDDGFHLGEPMPRCTNGLACISRTFPRPFSDCLMLDVHLVIAAIFRNCVRLGAMNEPARAGVVGRWRGTVPNN
jgi:hypothetical protein